MANCQRTQYNMYYNYNTKFLSDNIVSYFTGDVHKNSSVIKTNSKNLSVNGELHFLWSFNAWKKLTDCDENCASILQHFAHTHVTREIAKKKEDVDEEVLNWLLMESRGWPLQIHKYILQKERVCLFLNRRDVVAHSINMALLQTFVRKPKKSIPYNLNKAFHLRIYDYNGQSRLTVERLRMMRDFGEKMLRLHHYLYETFEGDKCGNKYIFTSKSVVDKEYKDYKKYVCGVVKNSQSNLKETDHTWTQYMDYKVYQLAKSNEQCKLIESSEGISDSERDRINCTKIQLMYNLTRANAIFEWLGVKPSRAVVIGDYTDDTNVTNTKGGSFVYYNVARIGAILVKYDDRVSLGDYPKLSDNIEDVDFSQLCEEEEWELVYNFIFRYPQVLEACLKCEPNFEIHPHVLCSFLLRLSHKFSAYYRKTRILLEGDHLIPMVVARIYMVAALLSVFRHAFSIFGIPLPLSRM